MHATVSTAHYHIYLSIQGLGELDHELGSNEHLLGISSAGPCPATSMNYSFPPARYSNVMPVGYDDPPHLAMVGVHLPIFTSPSLMVALSKCPGGYQCFDSQCQFGGHPTPGMTQRIPFAPPRLEYDAPAITVRVPSSHFFSLVLTACLAVH